MVIYFIHSSKSKIQYLPESSGAFDKIYNVDSKSKNHKFNSMNIEFNIFWNTYIFKNRNEWENSTIFQNRKEITVREKYHLLFEEYFSNVFSHSILKDSFKT